MAPCGVNGTVRHAACARCARHRAWQVHPCRPPLRASSPLTPRPGRSPPAPRENCSIPVDVVLSGANLSASVQHGTRPTLERLLGRQNLPAHARAGMIRSRDLPSTPLASGSDATGRLNPSHSTTPTGIEQKPTRNADRPRLRCRTVPPPHRAPAAAVTPAALVPPSPASRSTARVSPGLS
jgi:hypothetical protein